MLKIDQHLTKLETKIWWQPFLEHGVLLEFVDSGERYGILSTLDKH